MADEEQPQDDRPELDFNFAAGWPEDVQDNIRTLFAFDLADVRGLNRLGDLSFDAAPEEVESIRSMARDLAEEQWDQLPGSITEGHITGQLQKLNSVLDQMVELSAGQEGAAASKATLEQQLGEVHEWFKREVRPQAITAQVNRRVAAALGGRGEEASEALTGLPDMKQLAAEVERVRRDLEAQQDLASAAREAAGESAGAELSVDFGQRATDLGEMAGRWFRALIAAGVVAFVGGVVTFLVLRPDGGADDASDFAALGLAVFIVGLLVFAIRVCAQNYRVNRHLQAVASSKAAALSTFRRLVSSVEEGEVRSAVALALAQAVFATEETGLVDSAGDHVTLVERAVVPRLGGGGAA